MRICIVVDVDEEVADPAHHTGLTRQAYAQVTEAITSVVGNIVSVRSQPCRHPGKPAGVASRE